MQKEPLTICGEIDCEGCLNQHRADMSYCEKEKVKRMSSIKPCPVCGFDDDLLICWGKSSESTDREWFFYCMECDYIYSCVAKSISEAIESWNEMYDTRHKKEQKE